MSDIIDYLFDRSNQILGIPIIIVILATLKAFHYGKTQETENKDDELDSDILNKIVHDHHDASKKIEGFCPHCEKKYMIPPDIGIKVTCPSCHQENYHNI